MKQFKIFIIILLIIIFPGCAGLADYGYNIVNGYKLNYNNSSDVRVILENYSGYEEYCLPTKIVEIAWNDRYIIAKQYELVDRNEYKGDTYKIPDKNKVNYWILDSLEKERYGPYTLDEFNEQLEFYNITNLKLKPTIYYKK